MPWPVRLRSVALRVHPASRNRGCGSAPYSHFHQLGATGAHQAGDAKNTHAFRSTKRASFTPGHAQIIDLEANLTRRGIPKCGY
ncbi:hypothetical protein KCP73_12195 [Salmonella enterica subsp. enterica]|nr:hypothetical protein KCP73_12195 [Salmonella enterica subsp. enterica]